MLSFFQYRLYSQLSNTSLVRLLFRDLLQELRFSELLQELRFLGDYEHLLVMVLLDLF